MKMKQRPVVASGFSLLEVMVAASILLIGLAGILSGFATLQEQKGRQLKRTQAMHAAEAHIEELLMRFAGHVDLDDGKGKGPISYGDDGMPRAGGPVTVTWDVIDGDPIAGVKRLTVHSSYDIAGRTEVFDLSTVRGSQ